MKKIIPDRIHLLAHANPATKDLERMRFRDVYAYLDFVREHLPEPYILTCNPDILTAPEDERRGGRRDDAARVVDMQAALDDPHTAAIVALAGGAYFTRLLPRLDFSGLQRRRAPLWTLGFSEMTTFVNIVASYPCGRGLYWLGPNYLGRKIKPLKAAREALAEFWRTLPAVLRDETPRGAKYLPFNPITGRLACGKTTSGDVRLIGGCLTVLITMLAGPLGRRLEPDGKWLVLEDLQEAPYRVDRYLSTLTLAGWFERVAGVILGAFHTDDTDDQRAVLEMLRFHLPKDRELPVVLSKSFGHVWPMVPVPINQSLRLTVRGRSVVIGEKAR